MLREEKHIAGDAIINEVKVKITPAQIMSLAQAVETPAEMQSLADYLMQKNNKFLELINIDTCCRNNIIWTSSTPSQCVIRETNQCDP